jgi:hypothetical protein
MYWLTLFSVLGSSTAHATATPLGEFVGDVLEDWESYDTAFVPCYDLDADTTMCSDGSLHATSSWGYICSINPVSGSRFLGNTGPTSTLTFDTPVEAFGSWWGTNNGGETATFQFFDASDVLVGEDTIELPCGDDWQWGGWSFSRGVSRIEVVLPGTHLMSDNLTWTYGEGGGGGGGDTDLELGGACPASATIDISGAPGADFLLVVGDRAGTTVVPSGGCAGLVLGVESAVGAPKRFGPLRDGDGDGVISLSPRLPDSVCASVYQAVDLGDCSVSPVRSF